MGITEQELLCVDCGKPLTGNQTKYCSKKCKERFCRWVRKGFPNGKPTYYCVNCGRELTGKQTMYCSDRCLSHNYYMGPLKSCASCDKPLEEETRRYCSPSCCDTHAAEQNRDDCMRCGAELTHRQRLWCSENCMAKYRWHNDPDYRDRRSESTRKYRESVKADHEKQRVGTRREHKTLLERLPNISEAV